MDDSTAGTVLTGMDLARLRNTSIIAHIAHGKSPPVSYTHQTLPTTPNVKNSVDAVS